MHPQTVHCYWRIDERRIWRDERSISYDERRPLADERISADRDAR